VVGAYSTRTRRGALKILDRNGSLLMDAAFGVPRVCSELEESGFILPDTRLLVQ
jgi:hypothetical protein